MTVKLFACGDIVNSRAKENFIDMALSSIIQDCDIAVCNFEAPIARPAMSEIPKAGPCLYQDEETISTIKAAGFNLLSLANNHIYDYGDEGLGLTLREAKLRGVTTVGAGMTMEDAYKPQIFVCKGIKVGVLAACENEFGCLYEEMGRGGYAWIFHSMLEEEITKLKKKVDFLVLIAHTGVENIDIPIKEWRERYQRLCKLGVDVIVGHHPHVPQGIERYGNSLIFYSLGNFYFDPPSGVNNADDSFSVVLSFAKGVRPSFEIVYHKKIEGQVRLVGSSDVKFSIEQLNMLLEHDYQKLNNHIVLQLFDSYYYGYYQNAFGAPPKHFNIMQKIVFWIKEKLALGDNQKSRNLLLLHNIRIESHRFVVQRALSLLYEKNETPR
jgi:poly-gamma-glutamate synthesis protein (capsule biosynthesis protein)